MDRIAISLITGISGMISYGVGEFTAKKAVDKLGNTRTFFWIQIISLAVAFIVAAVVKINFSASPLFIFLSLVVTVTYALAYILAYKSYEVGNLSIVSPIGASYGIVSVAIAAIFLKQELIGFQIVGIPLLIIGIVFISVTRDPKKGNISLTKGVIPALGSAFLFGINGPLIDYIVANIDWLLFALITTVASVALMSINSFLSKERISISKNERSAFRFLLPAALLTILGNIVIVYGFSVGDSIIIAPLGSASVAITVLLALIFLKDKLKPVQIAGILLTILGIIFTAL